MSTTFGLINNLKNIKQNIYTSLLNKGVVVGENNKLEDVPDYIDGITTGGGNEDWNIENIAYLFGFAGGYQNENNKNIFNEIMSHVNKISTLYYSFSLGNYDTTWLNGSQFQEIVNKSNGYCTNYLSAFRYNGSNINGIFNLDVSGGKNLDDTFRDWRKINATDNQNEVTLNFNGTTNNLIRLSNTFDNGTTANPNVQIIKEILNLNLDKVTSITSGFNNCQKITRLTFQGSVGGLTTTTTLTLDLSKLTGMTTTSFIETFTSLSNNTNLKTRIIKIPSAIYNSLTSEEIAIATNKGYTVTA